ncbi:DUF3095 domain-containing protein [Rhizobium sp. ARZ01]|uniref:DUF3095 domain-containing protein n=1 Tax=Rhizobium sp. ARZ01 TaxID=2769313 RepID=UPI00177F22E6|nr:DUF3095 domain-containing protein [Rhizobium sp. ARZ01]MBD9371364.1 DUF3095 domain-containing protein [Rhizobium sp. ARZ01]
MVDSADDDFFSTLASFSDFEGVADEANYHPLPDGWALVLADIVDSTGAIEAGRYKSVNMAGASVISGVLNAIGRHDLPFVFGGDGALVAVPAMQVGTARAALSAVQRWTMEELKLDMRGAVVPVSTIRAAGQDVLVARYRVNEFVSYAMFAGGGAAWAERRMKEGLDMNPIAPPGARPDLAGLSCRWNPIAARHGEIVSIIAVPVPGGSEPAFRTLVSDVVALAAREESAGRPVSIEGLRLGLSPASLDAEARAAVPKGGRLRRKAFIVLQYLLMQTLLRLGLTLGRFDPKRYRNDIVANSDFRKFDDGLKMTLDVDPDRLAEIEARLERARLEGVCRYGLHRQDTALMTCVVPTPLARDHVHFIDGASGGYAVAAAKLKAALTADAPAANAY